MATDDVKSVISDFLFYWAGVEESELRADELLTVLDAVGYQVVPKRLTATLFEIPRPANDNRPLAERPKRNEL